MIIFFICDPPCLPSPLKSQFFCSGSQRGLPNAQLLSSVCSPVSWYANFLWWSEGHLDKSACTHTRRHLQFFFLYCCYSNSKLEDKSMWFCSFAWRKAKRKTKAKVKKQRLRESDCHLTLQNKALPSLPASFKKNNLFLFITNKSLTKGQPLCKVSLWENTESQKHSAVWELLAGLYNTPI